MKKLPVIGTTAATTAFCYAQIDAPNGLHLFVDGNGKITRDMGTLDAPKPNAFSIRNHDDCPGKTPTCSASCYVEGLKKHAADTYTLYEHNSDTIRKILAMDSAFIDAWTMRMAEWINANCTSFRWHVSGDVFSAEYAEWIRDVCRESPNVQHWIYTRSFDYAATLMEVSTLRGGNLAVNLSADRDNISEAEEVSYDLGKDLPDQPRICYLTNAGETPFLVEGDVIFPDYRLRGGTPEGQAWFAALEPGLKAMVCPVDFHGKAENRRCGPCKRCLT